jgi:hypothetical protein
MWLLGSVLQTCIKLLNLEVGWINCNWYKVMMAVLVGSHHTTDFVNFIGLPGWLLHPLRCFSCVEIKSQVRYTTAIIVTHKSMVRSYFLFGTRWGYFERSLSPAATRTQFVWLENYELNTNHTCRYATHFCQGAVFEALLVQIEHWLWRRCCFGNIKRGFRSTGMCRIGK